MSEPRSMEGIAPATASTVVGQLDSPNNPILPVMDYDQMKVIAMRLTGNWMNYKTDRRSKEEQWVRNARQFRGIYDPEIERYILADQSKAYPKITRTKVIGTLSRLMEMLFPQTEKNWAVKPGSAPELTSEDLQHVLDTLQQLHDQAGEQGDIPSEVIEKAVVAFASERAEAMSATIDDQLSHMEYVTLARKVVFSGINYGTGLLKGPLIRKVKTRTWNRDSATGRYMAIEQSKLYPFYEFCSVWEWYPDLSAKTIDQMDGSFFRHIMSRQAVSDLANRPDFFGNVIREYLAAHTSGNYIEEWWEQMLRREGDKKNITDLSGRKFQLLEWWGSMPGHELRATGVKIPDSQLGEQFEANVWTLGDATIKAIITPYLTKRRPYKVFIYEEDDINLLGSGLPEVIRDSQMAICEASRMLLDNASVVCGPILELNTELLIEGQNTAIHAFKTYLRDGLGQDANIPAVREIHVDSHITELAKIIELFMNFANIETALPPTAMGDVTQGGSEALRTTGGVSMLMSAAALPIRDVVRNFDTFTENVVGSIYDWNMQFNPNQNIKGDYEIIARGSSSLIAKEVRGNALDQFKASLSPEEVDYVDTGKLLKERAKARDIPNDIWADDAQVKQRQDARAQQLAQNQQNVQAQVSASVKEVLSSALKNMALANKADTSASTQVLQTIIEGILNGIDSSTRARVAEHDISMQGKPGASKSR